MQEISRNSVFVSGLPFQTQKEEVFEVFRSCGQILSVNFPVYQDSGKSRGYCHVEFATQAATKLALDMNKSTFKGRYLDISQSRGPKPQKVLTKEEVKSAVAGSDRTIFVKNLPYDADVEEIGEFFKGCGKITDVRMVHNTVTKIFKGFCYIEFLKSDSLYAAAKLNGADFRGRSIRVDIANGVAKKGFRVYSSKVSRFETTAKMIKIKKEKKTDKKKKMSGAQIQNLHPKPLQKQDEFKSKIKKLNIF